MTILEHTFLTWFVAILVLIIGAIFLVLVIGGGILNPVPLMVAFGAMLIALVPAIPSLILSCFFLWIIRERSIAVNTKLALWRVSASLSIAANLYPMFYSITEDYLFSVFFGSIAAAIAIILRYRSFISFVSKKLNQQ